MLFSDKPRKTRADVVAYSMDPEFEQKSLELETALAEDLFPGDVITEEGTKFDEDADPMPALFVVLEPAKEGEKLVIVHGIGVVLNSFGINPPAAIPHLLNEHVKLAL